MLPAIAAQRLRCQLPNRMVPIRRHPGAFWTRTQMSPREQNGRKTDASDRHRMRQTSQQQRELIECCQARKYDRIDSPRDRPIATQPEWHPRQPATKRAKKTPSVVMAKAGDDARPFAYSSPVTPKYSVGTITYRVLARGLGAASGCHDRGPDVITLSRDFPATIGAIASAAVPNSL